MQANIHLQDGVRLGSSLWFDAEKPRPSSILTTLLHRLPAPHQRMIASEPVVAALNALGFGSVVLPVPWGRSLRFGGVDVQLLNVGQPLTSAAFVECEGKTILVAGVLAKSCAELPLTNQWVIQAPALGHVGKTHEEALLDIKSFIVEVQNKKQRPGVWVESFEVGLWLFQSLAQEGISTLATGILGKLIRTDMRKLSKAPVIALKGTSRVRVEHWLWLDTGLGEVKKVSSMPKTWKRISLEHYLNASSLALLVNKYKPEQLFIQGGGADAQAACQNLLAEGMEPIFSATTEQLHFGQDAGLLL